MNTFTQKTTALTIATIITIALFSNVDASETSAHALKANQVPTAIQKVTVTGKRMTAEQKLQFDLANAS